jgi:ATP-dependent protease HslVU (ClpYQ) peptidase subunit
MTCIVALVDGDDVIVGGDSAAVAGLNVIVRKDHKVFHNGPAVMGFTTSFRMGQLLRFNLDIVEKHPNIDAYEWMCKMVIPEVRHTLKEGGLAQIEDNVESGGTFLMGAYGRLFEVDEDFQVGEPHDEYAAVGCGTDFALGALAVSEWMDPVQRVLEALKVAAKFSGGVRPPFNIIRLSDPDFLFEWTDAPRLVSNPKPKKKSTTAKPKPKTKAVKTNPVSAEGTSSGHTPHSD